MTPEAWALFDDDPRAAQVRIRRAGRRITHISRLTWLRVEDVLERPRAVGARRPDLDPLGHGVAISHGHVVLARPARPDRDPLLLLRVCADAAERALVLAPATAPRVVAEVLRMFTPRPAPAPPIGRAY